MKRRALYLLQLHNSDDPGVYLLQSERPVLSQTRTYIHNT